MHIVIPGALPPAAIAGELVRAIEQDCPALIRLFECLTPRVVSLHPAQTGCTPAEYEMLEQHGGLPVHGVRAVQALAALHAGVTMPDETTWVAQLCAMSIGHEQVTLALPEELDILPEESTQLMDDVLAIVPPTGFRLMPIHGKLISHAWQVHFDAPLQYASISPRAVRGLSVTDWWPQDSSTRIWRKWVNEVQMAWHSHPINQERMNRGLDAINGLWLYGGGPGWSPQSPASDRLTLSLLEHPHAQGDWSEWIRALQALNQALATQPDVDCLTLLGDARKVVLTKENRSWWKLLGGARKRTWSQWWNPQP